MDNEKTLEDYLQDVEMALIDLRETGLSDEEIKQRILGLSSPTEGYPNIPPDFEEDLPIDSESEEQLQRIETIENYIPNWSYKGMLSSFVSTLRTYRNLWKRIYAQYRKFHFSEPKTEGRRKAEQYYYLTVYIVPKDIEAYADLYLILKQNVVYGSLFTSSGLRPSLLSEYISQMHNNLPFLIVGFELYFGY